MNEKIKKLKALRKELTTYTKDNFKWYSIYFKSIEELYNYLTSNPKINNKIFVSPLSIISKNNDWSRISLEEAINYLKGGYSENIERLFVINEQLKNAILSETQKRRVIRSFTGSRICPNAFVTNDPKRYYKLERISEKKLVNIHVNLANPGSSREETALIRGSLIYNLISVLEENNYEVNLRTFSLEQVEDEIIYIKIDLKQAYKTLNESDLVFPLTSIDFSRRILTRIIETMPVENPYWKFSYGTIPNDENIKKLLSLSKEDIYIGVSKEMGINGLSLREDTKNFLNYIGIENYAKVRVR